MTVLLQPLDSPPPRLMTSRLLPIYFLHLLPLVRPLFYPILHQLQRQLRHHVVHDTTFRLVGKIAGADSLVLLIMCLQEQLHEFEEAAALLIVLA
jgi:hypothetical protein